MTLETEFWKSREALARIHQQARARRVSPWAVFGGVLARVLASVEPSVQLPPIVGGFGSLNLFIGIVGRSGQGKGASQAAAAALLETHWGALFDTVSVGSGEGIAAAYVQRGKDEAGNPAITQHAESALLDVAEIDTLTALAGRQGSTLLAELRKVWSGERLGFQNRDSARTLPVEAHKYRAALVAGIQPSRAGSLLDDVDGGTPQRFIWLPATDPGAPENAPQPPTPLVWKMPGEADLPTLDGRRVLRVCDDAWNTLDRAQVARLRGDGHALDGHALFSRLKIAAALALLDMRGEVSSEDWELSNVVMRVSDQTREYCRQQILAASRAANEARAESRAEASVVIADHAEIAALARAKERILAKVGRDWTSSAPIRSNLSAKLRGHFANAVTELVETHIIEVSSDEYQGRSRTRFRLTPSPAVAVLPALPATPESPGNHADLSGGRTVLVKPPAPRKECHHSTAELEEGAA